MKPVRVAIVGAGSRGVADDHRAAFGALPDAAVVAGVDLDPAARDRVAAAWGVPVYGSLQQLARSRAVDLVVVCAPDRLHHQLAAEALDHGWAVLVEKPLAESVTDATDLYERAAARGLYLGVATQRTYMHPEIDALAANRTYGRARHIEAWWLRREPGPDWRTRLVSRRGGVLADLGSHVVGHADGLLARTEPTSVTAHLWRPAENRVDTYALLHVGYADGSVARLTLGWGDHLTAGEHAGLTVRWSLGAVSARLLTVETPAEAARYAPVVHTGGPDRPHTARLGRLRTVPECATALARHVVDAVRRGGPAPADERQRAMRVMRILDAAYRSSDQGGAPVVLTQATRKDAQ